MPKVGQTKAKPTDGHPAHNAAVRRPQTGLPRGHVCAPLACGIHFDPACPVWGGKGWLPWRPVTFAEFVATLRSPNYRDELLAVLLELLAPEIGRLVAELHQLQGRQAND